MQKINQPRKPTPLKFCNYCKRKLIRYREKDGEWQSLLHFKRRKFCNFLCMSLDFKTRRKNKVLSHQGHWRARQLISKNGKHCEICKKTKVHLDIHHKDRNKLNNGITIYKYCVEVVIQNYIG